MDATQVAHAARQAAAAVAVLPTAVKDNVLRALAQQVEQAAPALRAANAEDLAAARAAGQTEAKLRRLALTEAAIAQMAAGLRQIAELPDPVGRVAREYTVPSGLHVRRVRCPLGVVLMIYEARPNVTVDAFALCFKAGNACILKGGREAARSNAALADLARSVLGAHGAPADAVQLVTTSEREPLRALLQLDEYIDLCIPRGGTELIRFVHEHARMPTVQHFHGVCHIFVDESADLDMALRVCTTAKTSAPATCNAVEAILVHAALADTFVPQLVQGYAAAGVEVRGDAEVCRRAPAARPAEESDWGREFLDLIVAVRIVPDLDAAVAHIQRYGSNHTDAILSTDPGRQREFTTRVQSSCVLVNASTRFNDGFQLGLGAEIGISTSKVHAYGPMGLEELTATRFIVAGAGQTR